MGPKSTQSDPSGLDSYFYYRYSRDVTYLHTPITYPFLPIESISNIAELPSLNVREGFGGELGPHHLQKHVVGNVDLAAGLHLLFALLLLFAQLHFACNIATIHMLSHIFPKG